MVDSAQLGFFGNYTLSGGKTEHNKFGKDLTIARYNTPALGSEFEFYRVCGTHFAMSKGFDAGSKQRRANTEY
jgi:hypothetical protein